MRLTLHTDYGLRVLMALAVSNERVTIAVIADRYGISRNHLMKVVQRLAQLGLVHAERGRSGGLRLAALPDEINLGAVVRAMEETGSFVECLNSATNSCVVTPVCGLRGILGGALLAFLRHLDRFTLADLVPQPGRMAAILRLDELTAPVP